MAWRVRVETSAAMTDALVPLSERPKRGLLRELMVGAGVAALALALPTAIFPHSSLDGWPLVLAMSGLAFASYPMSRASNFLAQVLARAIWWQALAFGVVLAIGHVMGEVDGPIATTIPLYILGGTLALGGAGQVGLDIESEHFFPVAFRRSLTASLIMAIADTIALAFYAGIVLVDGSFSPSTLLHAAEFSGAALVMVIAISGLFRIKVWGLALNIVANVLIATLALTGVFDIPEVIAFGLAATAVAQLLLPLPLLKRMFTRT